MLVAGEEVGIAGDDRRLLARLLLAYPHGSSLLGALVEVAGEPRLELVGWESPQVHAYDGQPGASLQAQPFEQRPSSRRQRSFTFTRRSRKTGCAEQQLDLGSGA